MQPVDAEVLKVDRRVAKILQEWPGVIAGPNILAEKLEVVDHEFTSAIETHLRIGSDGARNLQVGTAVELEHPLATWVHRSADLELIPVVRLQRRSGSVRLCDSFG